MEALRRFFAIVLADARQRWRAPRLASCVLILVALTWFCFPAADAHYRVLGIGHFRVAYSSAWAGMVVAMLMTWLSLLGFFLVRGTLTRDIETHCWELLVATPLSRPGYLFAKWTSHLLVLVAIALGMLVMAAFALAVRVPGAPIDPLQLLLPALVLGLPALAIAALCAVLFDLVPMLRRTLGNALYAVLWIGMLAAGAAGSKQQVEAPVRIGDVHGITVFERDLAKLTATQGIDDDTQHICLLCGSAASEAAPLVWARWSPAPADLIDRLFWLLLPLPALALAARGLDRAARSTTRTQTRRTARRLGWLQFLLSPLQGRNASALLSLELQQGLRERPLWIWAALLAAWAVQLFATTNTASIAVIAAWALLLPLFSHAALREREFATAAVVFSSVGARSRLLRVRLLGLLLIGVVCAAPALARFAAIESMLCVTLLGLIVSLAVWALALASLTGSARPFELLFLLGALFALNGVPALDASIAPLPTLLVHLALLPPALILLAFAWARSSGVPART
jgi:hypothetical protein